MFLGRIHWAGSLTSSPLCRVHDGSLSSSPVFTRLHPSSPVSTRLPPSSSVFPRLPPSSPSSPRLLVFACLCCLAIKARLIAPHMSLHLPCAVSRHGSIHWILSTLQRRTGLEGTHHPSIYLSIYPSWTGSIAGPCLFSKCPIPTVFVEPVKPGRRFCVLARLRQAERQLLPRVCSIYSSSSRRCRYPAPGPRSILSLIPPCLLL